MELVWLFVILMAVGVPVQLMVNHHQESEKKKAAEKFAETVDTAINGFRADGGGVTLPFYDPAENGYRPVGNENLFAIHDDVSKVELRSTGKYKTSGSSISVPIIKGVRYRVGSGSIRSEKQLMVTATGRLILTDKAVAFESREGNSRLTWAQIADVEIHPDCITLHRRNGQPLKYSVPALDPEFAAVAFLMMRRVS